MQLTSVGMTARPGSLGVWRNFITKLRCTSECIRFRYGAWVRCSELASVIHAGLLLALTSCQVLALQVGARLAVLSLFCSFERVLQHNYGWLQNCSVAQASLKLGSA